MRQTFDDQRSSKNKTQIQTLRWHTAQVGVQVSDTDYGGGVYHGRYFNLFHQARDRFWEDLGMSTLALKQEGFDLTVAELHTKFIKSVYYGDTLEVRTRVLWFRQKSMGLVQEMTGTAPDKNLCGKGEDALPTLRCQTEMNLVCTTRGKAVPLPPELIGALTEYYGI